MSTYCSKFHLLVLEETDSSIFVHFAVKLVALLKNCCVHLCFDALFVNFNDLNTMTVCVICVIFNVNKKCAYKNCCFLAAIYWTFVHFQHSWAQN